LNYNDQKGTQTLNCICYKKILIKRFCDYESIKCHVIREHLISVS
jgi:hypothetical protein